MQLKRAVLEVRFKDTGRVFNWRAQLAQSIIGKALDGAPENPINEGVEINITESKAKVQLQSRRFSIVFEDCSNTDAMKKVVEQITQRAASSAGWSTVVRIGVRTVWIEDYNGSFDELLGKIRETNFAHNELVDAATDIAVNLTMKDGDNGINYVSGPMTKKELEMKYSITEGIPEVFTTVDTDYYSLQEDRFEKNKVARFFEKAMAYEKGLADKTKTIVYE